VLYRTYIRASPHGSVTSDAKSLANLLIFRDEIFDGKSETQQLYTQRANSYCKSPSI